MNTQTHNLFNRIYDELSTLYGSVREEWNRSQITYIRDIVTALNKQVTLLESYQWISPSQGSPHGSAEFKFKDGSTHKVYYDKQLNEWPIDFSDVVAWRPIRQDKILIKINTTGIQESLSQIRGMERDWRQVDMAKMIEELDKRVKWLESQVT